MSAPGAVRRVAVLAAMVPELRPIVRALSLRRVEGRPERLYESRGPVREGSTRPLHVAAGVTSMGTTAATEVTERVLSSWSVDHVIVVGIAGSIGDRLAIGELVVPEVVVDEATGAEVRPVPLGGFDPRGRLLTTDELHNDPDEVLALAERGFVAVDMETAAIGAVCEHHGVPWSAFRAISDRAGDPAVDDAVLGLARPDGSADVGAIVRFVVTKPWRVPELAHLGRGMRAAVDASTNAALAALAELRS